MAIKVVKTDRMPPYSQEAEQAVLGAILLDHEALPKALDILTADGSDFYHPAHIAIFKTVAELHNQKHPVDSVTVVSALRQRDDAAISSVGGPSYIGELLEATPTSANMAHYAKIVKEKAVRRHIIHRGGNLVSAAFEENNLEELISDFHRDLSAVSLTNKNPYTLAGVLAKQVFEELETLAFSEDGVNGIPSGFRDIDSLIGGFQPPEIVLIAARPSVGKTALMAQIATTAGLRGSKVGIFSIEVGQKRLMKNIFSMQSRVNTSKFRNAKFSEEEWSKIGSIAGRLVDTNIYLDDQSSLVHEIRRQARRMKNEGGLDIIFIDHLQEMRVKEHYENRAREVGIILSDIRSLAKELQVPIIVLAQLNRRVEDREDKIPTLSDLKESGATEEKADIILFIHRDEYYKKEKSAKPAVADIVIAKNRNGAQGRCQLRWNSTCIRFDDMYCGTVE